MAASGGSGSATLLIGVNYCTKVISLFKSHSIFFKAGAGSESRKKAKFGSAKNYSQPCKQYFPKKKKIIFCRDLLKFRRPRLHKTGQIPVPVSFTMTRSQIRLFIWKRIGIRLFILMRTDWAPSQKSIIRILKLKKIILRSTCISLLTHIWTFMKSNGTLLSYLRTVLTRIIENWEPHHRMLTRGSSFVLTLFLNYFSCALFSTEFYLIRHFLQNFFILEFFIHKKTLVCISVVDSDPDPHGSGTWIQIRIRN